MTLQHAIETFGGAYRMYGGGAYRESAGEDPDGGFRVTWSKGSESLKTEHYATAASMHAALDTANKTDWIVPERLVNEKRYGERAKKG